MRILELSNHPGKMLQTVHDKRLAEEQRAHRQYKKELAAHRRRLTALRDNRVQARLSGRWLQWLRAVLASWRERKRAPRPPVRATYSSAEEEALAAGMSGEQAAAVEFGNSLGDDWTLLRGYRNRGGEIDQLLLGPRGLFAIEVKYRNATVHCDGDEWWYDKYDQYGNLVETDRPLTDRKGRSPSRQVNEAADRLEDFLRSRGLPVEIERVVLFNHPRSALGDLRNLTVHVATSTEWILRNTLKGSAAFLDETRLERLEKLVLRDHRFHETRRRR
jgi:Nuclease-related domain